jgi:hypothetical protein
LAELLDRQLKIIEQLDACGADSSVAMEIYIALGGCLHILIDAEKALDTGRKPPNQSET